MSPKATIANTLCGATNLPAYWRFRRALCDPGLAQRQRLRELLARNSNTAFGKAHAFDRISNHEEFSRRVPLVDYAGVESWVDRIRRGEKNILTAETVTHLVPTSGSTAARKLIPFTAGLQREFNAAIGPWLVDLSLQHPGIMGGPAYWSVTPALEAKTPEPSAVPIGFDTDAAYLGGIRRKLAEAVMAVPSNVGRKRSMENFRYETLLHLLRCRELRLISVWHPSFLTLLLDALPGLWKSLIDDIAKGSGSRKPLRQRAAELRCADPGRPETFWPKLRVISCWGDAAASIALQDLRRRFPNVAIQAKGLIATESFVTLPFGQHHLLAINSHFFEFIDPDGRIFTAETLREGSEYEIAVTTAGGLWRYRLGDRVSATGFMDKTPSLKFLGRGVDVSDRFGEKLSESFVNEALDEIFGHQSPRFALVAPDEQNGHCGYTLYVEGAAHTDWAENLDQILRRNPHYAYCRDLGQLSRLRLFKVAENGYERFARRQAIHGSRIGDIKPKTLSGAPDWSTVFSGKYVT
jgi:hypothetical protein